jgi:hypothetical protein
MERSLEGSSCERTDQTPDALAARHLVLYSAKAKDHSGTRQQMLAYISESILMIEHSVKRTVTFPGSHRLNRHKRHKMRGS